RAADALLTTRGGTFYSRASPSAWRCGMGRPRLRGDLPQGITGPAQATWRPVRMPCCDSGILRVNRAAGELGLDMALGTDPYAVLGVPRDASDDQIAQARRRLSRADHPAQNLAADA